LKAQSKGPCASPTSIRKNLVTPLAKGEGTRESTVKFRGTTYFFSKGNGLITKHNFWEKIRRTDYHRGGEKLSFDRLQKKGWTSLMTGTALFVCLLEMRLPWPKTKQKEVLEKS